MKIAVLVGHGKSRTGNIYDSGAVNGNIHEFKVARDIAKSFNDYLIKSGHNVTLVNYNGDYNVDERARMYKSKTSADLVIEVHLNASTNKTATGTECYYYKSDMQGKKIAEKLCENVSKTLNIINRGAKVSNFLIVNSTGPTALLFETAFISNDAEIDNVINHIDDIGYAMAKSVNEVYGGVIDEVKTDTVIIPTTNATTTAKPTQSVTKTNYLAKYNGKSVSIVDALKSIKVDSSFSYRSKIAKANKISGYVGLASQNTKMLNLLKQGKLIKP